MVVTVAWFLLYMVLTISIISLDCYKTFQPVVKSFKQNEAVIFLCYFEKLKHVPIIFFSHGEQLNKTYIDLKNHRVILK